MGAVNQSDTPTIMIDRNFKTIYANLAILKFMQENEEIFQKKHSKFMTTENFIVGASVNMLHKNYVHQIGFLGNPDSLLHQTNITVADLEFNLTVISLKDSKGNCVGTAVQWLDNTEEKDAQRQIDEMIRSAIAGNLDKRISTQQYTGFLKGLGDSINSMLDALVDPISNSIFVMQALARGDLSKSITGNYSGAFLALVNSVNESMDNLINIVGEISGASTNVFSAAREIAQDNNDLSQRIEPQAASLEKTVLAMEGRAQGLLDQIGFLSIDDDVRMANGLY